MKGEICLIFRKATNDDIDDLVENRIRMRIEREDSRKEVDFDDFQRRTYEFFLNHIQDESFIAWIALDEGKVIATSGLCFYHVPPTYENLSGITAYIMNMYTIPEYRERGIASRLLEYLIEEARSRSCLKVTLNASQMGRPLYEKYGFKDICNDMVIYLNNRKT